MRRRRVWTTLTGVFREKKWRAAALLALALGGGWAVWRVSTLAARREADCAERLRAVGLALRIYHNDFGVFPARLAELPPGGYLRPEEGRCPAAQARGGARDFDYVYIRGLSPNDDPGWPMAFEPLTNHGGAGGHFLYTDGHVEFRRPVGHAKELVQFRQAVQNAGRQVREQDGDWEVTPAPMSRPGDPP